MKHLISTPNGPVLSDQTRTNLILIFRAGWEDESDL